MDATTAPLFQQIAVLIEDSIVEGSLRQGERAPSSNELAVFHRINPATARKGLTLLAEAGVLSKQRGVGMFVSPEAKSIIMSRRRDEFAANYLAPLVDEAVKLGIRRDDLHVLIQQVAESRGLYE